MRAGHVNLVSILREWDSATLLEMGTRMAFATSSSILPWRMEVGGLRAYLRSRRVESFGNLLVADAHVLLGIQWNNTKL